MTSNEVPSSKKKRGHSLREEHLPLGIHIISMDIFIHAMCFSIKMLIAITIQRKVGMLIWIITQEDTNPFLNFLVTQEVLYVKPWPHGQILQATIHLK